MAEEAREMVGTPGGTPENTDHVENVVINGQDTANVPQQISKQPQIIELESTIDSSVKNLYDYKMERKFKGEDSRKGLVHRMVVISNLYHENLAEIGQHYEKFYKETVNQLQSESVTGLLLLYPKHCVQVVESSHDVLLELIRSLRQDEVDGEGHMSKSKIVSISHDIPQRLYQPWNYRLLDVQAPNIDEMTESSEEAAPLVNEMLLQLLKLGSYINKQPKMAVKAVMESLHGKVPELLPQQDSIHFLLEFDMECTTTPQEHLNKYQKPYEITLASELTWPMPVRLFPYN